MYSIIAHKLYAKHMYIIIVSLHMYTVIYSQYNIRNTICVVFFQKALNAQCAFQKNKFMKQF